MGDRQNKLGDNIRRLRKERGWTQDQLGSMANTTTIAMIESGKRGIATGFQTVRAIAAALGVAPELLYGFDPAEDPPALGEFLASMSDNEISPTEAAELRSLILTLPGQPTKITCALGLQMLRTLIR